MRRDEGDLLDRLQARLLEAWPERPGESLAELDLIGRVRRLNTLFQQAFADVYRPLDMQEGEFDILSALLRAGDPYTLSPTEIKRELTIPAATVTKRLYSLERKQLIKRERHSRDRRVLLVMLTAAGCERVHVVYPLLAGRAEEVLGGLGAQVPTANRQLRRVLLEVERRLARPDGDDQASRRAD